MVLNLIFTNIRTSKLLPASIPSMPAYQACTQYHQTLAHPMTEGTHHMGYTSPCRRRSIHIHSNLYYPLFINPSIPGRGMCCQHHTSFLFKLLKVEFYFSFIPAYQPMSHCHSVGEVLLHKKLGDTLESLAELFQLHGVLVKIAGMT